MSCVSTNDAEQWVTDGSPRLFWMSGRVFIVTKCSLASQFHPYTILFAVAESIQSGTRFTSSKQPRISAKNHLLIAFKRRVLDIVRRYLLADRYPKVTAWLFCNWYIEFNREHLIPLRKDSKPRASLRSFFYAPPKEQVVDRVIAAFAWSYYRVVELPKGQTTDSDTSRAPDGALPFRPHRDFPSP